MILNRRSVLTLFAFGPLLAKGKKTTHPKGFSFDLPDKWKWEFAEQGGVLLPPGVVVDPDKEDNPEVYSIRVPSGSGNNIERRYIEDLKADLKATGVEPERGGDIESFSQSGLGGVIYTFDFLHQRLKTPHRIRVYAMTTRGRLLLLIANGQRPKLEARDRALREVARSFTWK